MSDRSSQRKLTPDVLQAMGNVKEKKGRGTNDPELQAEGEAIDSAISSGLFLAPRQELLKKEAELKDEKEGGVKPMSDQTRGPETQNVTTPKTSAEIEKLEERKKMERVANEAAEKAGKTETRYDRDNDLFTK
jgi:hypothetical protein